MSRKTADQRNTKYTQKINPDLTMTKLTAEKPGMVDSYGTAIASQADIYTRVLTVLSTESIQVPMLVGYQDFARQLWVLGNKHTGGALLNQVDNIRVQYAASGFNNAILARIRDEVFSYDAPFPPGTLNVTSTPTGAEIYIDGVDKAVKTPQTSLSLPPGSHVLKLTLALHQDVTTAFVITSGQTVTLSLTMPPV